MEIETSFYWLLLFDIQPVLILPGEGVGKNILKLVALSSQAQE